MSISHVNKILVAFFLVIKFSYNKPQKGDLFPTYCLLLVVLLTGSEQRKPVMILGRP